MSVEAAVDTRKLVFTTGEAAELCKVSQQTIIRSFDSGRLGGFRVPGSKFRRIPRADLIKFMRANGIPSPLVTTTVLIIDDDPDTDAAFQPLLLNPPEGFRLALAKDSFDAGFLLGQMPEVVLFGAGVMFVPAQRVMESLALRDVPVKLIYLGKPPGRVAVHGFVSKPVNPSIALGKVQQLLERTED